MTGSGVTAGQAGGQAPLSPDQWRQLESLLDVLLDTPPERRAVLFAEVSGGDPARRAELERLVAECERAYPLLDRPATDRFAALVHSPPLQPSQVVAERYRITRELGRGGMATVYLAHDLKHRRDVALKVVRSELAAALGSGRFLREIEIAARLRHPHIVPLYDSGRAHVADPAGGKDPVGDGIVYYVMPYEDGQSLRERLRREGRLPVADAVSILRDVCEALGHAHAHGVVHRDIKPDNILLSGGHALVTDFGVARAATEATDSAATGPGIMLGTPAYMAPEQVAADPRVDHRADIYAAGVLAYEMLTGFPPFTADSPQDILAAQLTQTPTPIAAHRPDVPDALAALVIKCLEKAPADRWQRADDLVVTLHDLAVPSGGEVRTVRRPRWSTKVAAVAASAALAAAALVWMVRTVPRVPPPTPTPPALAVLVFDHGSQNDLEPLAVALTANLIGALGEVSRLNVRSLRSVLPYSDGRTPLDSVARSLGVPWLVSGRVYRLRDQTAASVELTDATGRHLASRRALVGDDPALVENLVTEVATMLRERIGEHVRLEGWRAGTRNREAFEGANRALYDVRDADLLMERDLLGARLRLRQADSTLESASRADPSWAEPYIQRAWIARKLALIVGPSGWDSDSVAAALGRGVRHAERALRVRPGQPRALEVGGALRYAMSLVAPTRDSAGVLLAEAERLLRLATGGDSTLARALTLLSSIHYTRGEPEQARLMAARAYAADAYTDDSRQLLSRLFQIDFDGASDAGARRWCTEYGRMYPQDYFPGFCRLMLMTWDPAEAPDPADARRLASTATAAAPPSIRSPVGAQLQTLLAGVLARLGLAVDATRVLDDVHAAIAADPSIAREPFGTERLDLEAGVRMRLGQPEVALDLLRTYVKRVPRSSERLARSRRFRGLPADQLRDAVERAR